MPVSVSLPRGWPEASQRVNAPDTDGVLAAHGLWSRWYTGRNGEPEVTCVQLKRGESARTFNYQTRNGPLT